MVGFYVGNGMSVSAAAVNFIEYSLSKVFSLLS